MIRSATASSTRCREVFPSDGFPPLALGLEPELELALALVLEPGALARADVVVMGRSSPSGNELSGPGCPRRRFGGNGHGAACPPGLSERQWGPSPGFQDSPPFTDGGNGALLCPSGAVVGIAWGVRAGRPPGLSERQWGPSPGFQSILLQFGVMGRFYALLGGLWESRGEVSAAAAVRRTAGWSRRESFRGCGGGLPGDAGGLGGRDGGGRPPFSTGFGDPLCPRASWPAATPAASTGRFRRGPTGGGACGGRFRGPALALDGVQGRSGHRRQLRLSPHACLPGW